MTPSWVMVARCRRSSGDTIPNCLGKLGETRGRTRIAADGHPTGAPGATGVVRRRAEFRGGVRSSGVPGTPYLTAWVNSGKSGRKRCQEPKNDFLASMYTNSVPDTLSRGRNRATERSKSYLCPLDTP